MSPAGTLPGSLPLVLNTADEIFGAVPAAHVAAALSVSRATLAAWRRRGIGPPTMRFSRLLTLYPVEPLSRWWASPAASRTRQRAQHRSQG